MNMLEFAYSYPNLMSPQKEMLLRYHTKLEKMSPETKLGFIAVYGSSEEGPVIASIGFLAMADMASFLGFSTYIGNTIASMIKEIDSGDRVVGDKRQTIATAASLLAYSKILRDEGLEVASAEVFDMNLVHDYISTLLCFLHLYRCCLLPDEVIDYYDGTILNNWLATCNVPMVKPLVTEETYFH